MTTPGARAGDKPPRNARTPALSGNLQKHTSRNRVQQWLLTRFHNQVAALVEQALAQTHDPHPLIVDVGCGEGFAAQALSRRLPHVWVVGLDIRREALTAFECHCEGARRAGPKQSGEGGDCRTTFSCFRASASQQPASCFCEAGAGGRGNLPGRGSAGSGLAAAGDRARVSPHHQIATSPTTGSPPPPAPRDDSGRDAAEGDPVEQAAAGTPSRSWLGSGRQPPMTSSPGPVSIPESGGDPPPDARNNRAAVALASAHNLPFRDGAVPGVLCLEVLEHLTDPWDALEELRRVSSSHLVLSVPDQPLFALANLARGKNLTRLGEDPEHLSHWRGDTFLRELSRRCEVVRAVRSFPWVLALVRK